jgi:hypothetical protein
LRAFMVNGILMPGRRRARACRPALTRHGTGRHKMDDAVSEIVFRAVSSKLITIRLEEIARILIDGYGLPPPKNDAGANVSRSISNRRSMYKIY